MANGHKWQKGETGNPYGRPKIPERQQLADAIKAVEKKLGKSFLIHCAEQAFKDPGMAKELLKKFIPDMKEIIGDLSGVFNTTVSLTDADRDLLRGALNVLSTEIVRKAYEDEGD